MRNPHEAPEFPQSDKGSRVYRVADMLIDSRHGFIRRAGSEDLYLRHQTLQVLLYLLAHRDRVVGKEELRAAIWGETAVTDDAFVQCVVDIRRALGDSARDPKYIKTLPRLGYRFVGPVEVIDADAGDEATPDDGAQEPGAATIASASTVELASSPGQPARGNWFRLRNVVMLGGALLGVALLVSSLWSSSRDVSAGTALPPTPGVRRVVVFYFENQSGSRRYDWLRHGLADMVITDLSRFDEVAVISRQQLELLLGDDQLARDQPIALDRALKLGKQTGANAIVMGSFAELGDKLRFEARLHDAETGRLLGSESAVADRPDEVITQADLVTLRVARHLGLEPGAYHSGGSLPDVTTTNLEAYRYYSLGLEKGDALKPVEAIHLFETALQHDPGFAMALARIGYIYVVVQGLSERGRPYLQKAFASSARLTEKDRLYIAAWYALANFDYPDAEARLNDLLRRYPLETEAWWRLGAILHGEGRLEEARTALQRGLASYPDYRPLINALGTLYQSMGRHQDAIAMHRRYTELAPAEPNAYDSLGLSYQYAGMYGQAIESYQKALSLEPRFGISVVHLGNVYFQLGRFNDAIAQYRRYIDVSDYESDTRRGRSSIAWVEWRRGHRAQAVAAVEALWSGPDLPPIEGMLIKVAEGTLPRPTEYLERLHAIANRGSRMTLRLEHYVRGEVALHDRHADEALAQFHEALAHPPTPWAMDTMDDCLASALLRLERWDEAATEYRRVLGINPNWARARYGLAVALDRRGEKESARQEYRRFLEIWRDADQDAPELIDASRRVAALSDTTRR